MNPRFRLGLLSLLAAGAAFGAETAATNQTVITSEHLTFDYRRYIAIFDRKVVVQDPQIRIETDQLNVLFGKEGEVKSVTALGNVRMWHGDKTGSCDKAVYVNKTGEVLLLGRAVLRRASDTVMGERITFWLGEDRMTCEPGRLYITPQGGGSAKGLMDIMPRGVGGAGATGSPAPRSDGRTE